MDQEKVYSEYKIIENLLDSGTDYNFVLNED